MHTSDVRDVDVVQYKDGFEAPPFPTGDQPSVCTRELQATERYSPEPPLSGPAWGGQLQGCGADGLHRFNLAGHTTLLPPRSQYNPNVGASAHSEPFRLEPKHGNHIILRTVVIKDRSTFEVFSMQGPIFARSQLGREVGLRKPSQDVLCHVLLLFIHEPMARALVVDNLGLGEELLDQTNAACGASTVGSSTEEDDGDVDRISQREVTGWSFKSVESCGLKRGRVYLSPHRSESWWFGSSSAGRRRRRFG